MRLLAKFVFHVRRWLFFASLGANRPYDCSGVAPRISPQLVAFNRHFFLDYSAHTRVEGKRRMPGISSVAILDQRGTLIIYREFRHDARVVSPSCSPSFT